MAILHDDPLPYLQGMYHLIPEDRLPFILHRTGRHSHRHRPLPANARAFGRPGTSRAEGAFPQIRLLALCELGTHAICGLTLKPCRRNEQVMAPALLDLLEPGMLLLWDRGFFSYDLVRRVLATGAHLLARVQARLTLTPLRRLADGSYLAKLYPSTKAREQGRDGLLVRVIEYTHDDPNRPGCGERHRLITALLN